MSSIFGGGTSSSSRASQNEQAAANAATQRFIEKQTAQGRTDVSSLFPSGQAASAAGSQGALNLLGASIPAQADIFQRGNVGAQQALINTLPQFQNAILGQPIDNSQFQPVNLGVDTSFLQGLQAPQAVQPVPVQQAQPNRFSGGLNNLSRFGGFRFGGF